MSAPSDRRGPTWAEGKTLIDLPQGQLSLIGETGPLEGLVFGSAGKPLTIGRDASCAITLPIPESSRRHASIEYRGGHFWVSDLGSLNGTRVNDELIAAPTVLADLATLAVCGQVFRVRLGIHEGREVVEDEEEDTETTSASSLPSLQPEPTAPQTPAPAASSRGPGVWVLLALVLVGLAAGGGVMAGRRRARGHVVVSQLPSATTIVPLSSTPTVTSTSVLAPARFEAVEPFAFTADADLTIVKVAASGTAVQRGDVVVQYRKAAENGEGRVAGVMRAPRNGVITGEVPAVGAHVATGADVLHLAERFHLVTSAAAVEGNATHCKISFADRPGLALSVDRGTQSGAELSFALTRIPEGLAVGDVGRIHVTCTE